MDVRVAGDACGLHPGAYLLEFGSYLLDGAAGQDEQEFVAAVADEGVGLTDAVPDDRRRHLQCQVAGLMAAGVVVDLEIVQVHDGDAEGAFEALHDVLIIAAVEGALVFLISFPLLCQKSEMKHTKDNEMPGTE